MAYKIELVRGVFSPEFLSPIVMQRVPHLFGKALRESGQALDRLGLTILGSELFKETYSRHRTIMPISVDRAPEVSSSSFVAPNASVIGNVKIGDDASVWYGTVLRADKSSNSKIEIGAGSNVQDRSVLSGDVSVGKDTTIGHGALMSDNVSIGDGCLIGQGSVCSSDVTIESNAILAAGAVVLPHTTIPAGQMWAGNPAIYIRDCTTAEIDGIKKQSEGYIKHGKEHAGAY